MVGSTLDYEAKRIWEAGRKEGIKEGETLMGRLVSILLDQGKPEDVKRAIEDSTVRQALYKNTIFYRFEMGQEHSLLSKKQS